jgi:condensin-2 complex subunit H2
MQFLRSFELGEENPNVFGDLKDDNASNTGINFDYDDPDMPNDIDIDLDVPTCPDEVCFINLFVFWLLCLVIRHFHFSSVQIIAITPKGTQDDIDTHENLDDLCRSHLVSCIYVVWLHSSWWPCKSTCW